ncbi:MAG: HEAT repeat domain-containing protein, partial [Cyanobacteria bacterium P01_C01_bin.38]
KTGNPIAVEPLITALNDSNSGVRENAALALGKIGNPIAVEPLITALNDSNSGVRENTTLALGKIGNPIAVRTLTYALGRSNSLKRWHVVEALGEIGNAIAVEVLILALIKHPDSDVRENAARALGEIKNEALISVFNHYNPAVRSEAAWALGKIANPQILSKLVQSPEIDIYDKHIFPLARTLALRFSKKPPRNKKGKPLIPVYPELVKYNPVWSFVKRFSFVLKIIKISRRSRAIERKFYQK